MAIEIAADEFQKSIMCIPEITSVIYGIFAHICKKQRAAVVKSKFSHIRSGIELLENKSDKDIDEIAKSIAVFPPVNILKKLKNFLSKYISIMKIKVKIVRVILCVLQ